MRRYKLWRRPVLYPFLIQFVVATRNCRISHVQSYGDTTIARGDDQFVFEMTVKTAPRAVLKYESLFKHAA